MIRSKQIKMFIQVRRDELKNLYILHFEYVDIYFIAHLSNWQL